MATGKTKQQFDQGLSHFHKGEYEKALSFFEEVIYEEPDNSEALYNLACCYSMTGKADNAIIYLARAANLNPHCQDWAKEDHEFDAIRNNPTFSRIVSGEEVDAENAVQQEEIRVEEAPDDSNAPDEETHQPVLEYEQEADGFQEMEFEQIDSQPQTEPEPPYAAPQQTAASEPPPLSDGTKTTSFSEPDESDLPPCARCEGIVREERRSHFPPLVSLLTIYVGVIMTIFMYLTILGMIGIPIIIAGLYMFARIDAVWVCQNCGASGKDAGQPDEHEENILQPIP